MKTTLLCMAMILLTITSASGSQPESIGHIQTLNGAATVIRNNALIPAATAQSLYSGDIVRTSKTGSLGIVLSDDTTFTLGPNSEIIIKDYLFNPKEGKFSMIAKMVKGTFSYISGLIGKLAPESIRMELPDATIAVRGTKLLVNIEE
jgi:hypothetical protein